MKPLYLLIIIAFFSSCRLIREVSKEKKDTTTVSKIDETLTRVDTSKIVKGKEYERITYMFPPGDTTIINNYYTQGKNPPPISVTVERGQEKEVTQTFDFEAWYKHKQDSTATTQLTKDVKSDTKVGPSTIEIILMIAVGLMFLKMIGVIPSFAKPKP